MKSRKVDYPVKPCVVCGKTFKPKTCRSNYCSKLCRDRHKTGRLTLDEYLRKLRSEAKGRKDSTCLQCGKVFIAKAGGWALKQIERGIDEWGKYCSRKCRDQHRKIKPERRVLNTYRLSRHFMTPIRFTQCKICGRWYKNNTTSQICSDQCRHKAYILREDKDRVSSRTIHCVICGVHFSRLFKNSKWTCSSGCELEQNKNLRRVSRHKRRAAMYRSGYERFDSIDVFVRDGWKCKACGIKTPEKNRGTTLSNAPELDHIIPLSKGGSHTMQNTQCLCRYCNINKGNGSLQDQLRLF